jgi:hypothetical protein
MIPGPVFCCAMTGIEEVMALTKSTVSVNTNLK